MIRDAIITNVYRGRYTADIMYRDTEEVVLGVRIAGRVFWPLQKDDFVIVGFLDGRADYPIILDKVLLRGDPRITDDPNDIHLIHEVGPRDEEGNITEITGRIEIKTDKDGNLSLEISGKVGTLNIKTSGDVKVDGSSVELGNNLAKLLVDNLPVCLFTGAKHQIGNTNVKV